MIGSRDKWPTGWRHPEFPKQGGGDRGWPEPFIPSPDQPMEEKAI